MLKNIKKILLLFMITIFAFSTGKSVFAATTFTTCTFSEGSYLRSTPGGTTLKDTDGSSFLIYEPWRAEVIDTTVSNGKTYKKLKINYYSNNYIGWVYEGYLKDFKDYTIDDNYANELRNKGFPETYILSLQKLHAVYPNWNFEVSKNGSGLDWNTVINEEYTPVYKNLICTNNLNAVKDLLSTDGAAYNAGSYNTFDNGCYAPSKQTISFYMDPRNWLNDRTVFMFEQLSFNESLHTTTNIQPILNNTFMSGSFSYNGGQMSYAQAFVDAGKTYNVSSIQLASRVLQEQGTQGSYTVNMKDGNTTYYNFFNVGASGNGENAIKAAALSTAKARSWTNPYVSILGGASTIANGYTKVGQDTNYYQKFNTINNGSLYINQYMANVRVNSSEAITIQKSYYNKGLINSSFTFKIPVYNNMPNETTLSTAKNSDNTLKSLAISNCTFNQEFNSTVLNYACNVPETVTSVNVSASATSSYASLTGTGSKSIGNGTTNVEVKVTAANGDVRTYTVAITKVVASTITPTNIISALGFNNSNNIVSGIALNTNVSTIINNVKNKYANTSITMTDKNNKAKTNGNIATGDKITITNNGITNSFTISVKGDVSGDGKIDVSDLALIKASMLGKISISGVNKEGADINKDGIVDVSDLAMVKAHMLGKITITK